MFGASNHFTAQSRQRRIERQALADLPAEDTPFATSQQDQAVSTALQTRSTSSGFIRTPATAARRNAIATYYRGRGRGQGRGNAATTRSLPQTAEEKQLEEEERRLAVEEKKVELLRRRRTLERDRLALNE